MKEAREYPILFGPMVQAILNNRKTETRRVVTLRNSTTLCPWNRLALDKAWVDPGFPDENGRHLSGYLKAPEEGVRGAVHRIYPRHQPGDVLWVRETWRPAARLGTEYLIEYRADGEELCMDAGLDGVTPKLDAEIELDRWRPSIFMPRWACRLRLQVEAVRAERLHDINEADAIREGMQPTEEQWGNCDDPEAETPRKVFAALWDEINGKRAPWRSNPWVWVVKFSRQTQKIERSAPWLE